jgi:predicted transcriptional regulator
MSIQAGGSSDQLPISDEIRKLGIACIEVIRSDVCLTPYPATFKGSNTSSRIICRLIKGKVSETVAQICRKLRSRGVDSDIVESLDIYLTNVFVEYFDKKYTEQKRDAYVEQTQKDAILDEIDRARNGNGADVQLSLEEWQHTLVDKFHILRQTVKENMPEIWEGLVCVLSVLKILNVKGCSLPLIGILLAPPSSYKTVVISLLRVWYCAIYRDSFTPAAFVTNTMSQDSEEDLTKLDLLPQIKNHLFLTPELNTIFTAREEVVSQLLGIISRVADGEGLMTHTGAHGARGYEGPLMFTWIGAGIDIPPNVYKLLGNIGAKMYFFRLPYKEEPEDELLAELNEDFDVRKGRIKSALFDYLNYFDICPIMEIPIGISPPIPKIEWDKSKDDKEARRIIVRLAILLSRLRCPVITWATSAEDSAGGSGNDDMGDDDIEEQRSRGELNYSVSLPENPSRASRILNNLANGHALLSGRNYVTLDDVPVVIKTALSTGPIDRVKVLSLLLAHRGKLTTPLIVRSLNVSKSTARRTMTEFKAIGIVDMAQVKLNDNNYHTQYRKVTQITLIDGFGWLLDEKFERLREGFEPQDYSGYVKGSSKDRADRQEEPPPSDQKQKKNSTDHGSQLVYEAVSITASPEKQMAFWEIYNALEAAQTSNPDIKMEVDRYTVSGQDLRGQLIASGKFFASEATEIIEYMVNVTKQLEMVMVDTYRRAGPKWNATSEYSYSAMSELRFRNSHHILYLFPSRNQVSLL